MPEKISHTPTPESEEDKDKKVSNSSFLARLIEAIKKMEQGQVEAEKTDARNWNKSKNKRVIEDEKEKGKVGRETIKKAVAELKKPETPEAPKAKAEPNTNVVSQYKELKKVIADKFADDPNVLYRETMKVYVGVRWLELENAEAMELKSEIDLALKTVSEKLGEPQEKLITDVAPALDLYRTKRMQTVETETQKKLDEDLKNLQRRADNEPGAYKFKSDNEEYRGAKFELEGLKNKYNLEDAKEGDELWEGKEVVRVIEEKIDLRLGGAASVEEGEQLDQISIEASSEETPTLETPGEAVTTGELESSEVQTGGVEEELSLSNPDESSGRVEDDSAIPEVAKSEEEVSDESEEKRVKSNKSEDMYKEIVDLEVNETIQNSILKIKNPQLRQALLKYFQKKNRSVEDSFKELAEIRNSFFDENQAAYLDSLNDPTKTFASDEDREAQLGVDFRADKDLFVHKIASEVVKQFSKDGRFNRREGFWTPDNMHHMQNFDIVDFFPERNADGAIPFSQGLLQLDSMFWKIISPPTLNHNDTYRLNLDQEIDAQVFFQLLQNRLGELGFNGDQIDRVIQRYQTLKDVKEAAHNFSYIANNADAEILSKHIMNLDAAKADFMLQNFEFIGAAMSARENALLTILSNNGGYIPSEFFGKDSKMFSYWEDLTKSILKTSVGVQRPGFELLDESDFQIKMAMEMSQLLMIGTQMLPRIIADARPAKDFRSEPMRGLAVNMGFFDIIVNKFRSGGLGFAGLHTIITGEEHSEEEAKLWDVDRFIEWLNAEQDDPVIGNRIVDLKNLFGQSDFYGPNSRWKERAVSGEMSREEYRSRGFAVRLADSRARMTEEAHRYFFEKHHITDAKEQAKFLQKHQHEIEHKVRELVIDDAKKILEEVLDRSPLAIAHHWSKENGIYGKDSKNKKLHWTRRRFDITEKVLGEDIKVLLDQLKDIRIKEYDKKEGKVVERKIESIYDLFRYNPLNYQPENEDYRLTTADRDLVQNVWSQVTAKINELETNLAAIQQVVVTKGLESDKVDNYYNLIKDDKMRARVADYVNRIRLASKGAYDSSGHSHYESYVAKFAEDVAEGRMRRLINMTDRKYENDHFSVAGPDVFKRVLNDNSSQTQAAKGASEWLANILNSQTYGKSTEDKLLFLVNLYKEKVFTPMAAVDPRLAQETSYMLWNAMLALKAEEPWAAYSGIFGDIAKFILPQRLQPSAERRMLGKDVGESLTPNHINSLMHMLVASGILNKSDYMPYKYGAGHEYSEHALAIKWGGRGRNVYAEMFMYVGPLVVFYTLFQAIKKGLEGEEEGKKHH